MFQIFTSHLKCRDSFSVFTYAIKNNEIHTLHKPTKFLEKWKVTILRLNTRTNSFSNKVVFFALQFYSPYFDTLPVRLTMFTILQKRFRLTILHKWFWNYSIAWKAIFFFVRMLKFLQHLTWIDSRVFYTTCLVSKHASERNCIWNPYRLFWEHFIRQGCL